VIDLKTGCVHTNLHSNRSDDSKLPDGSIYEPMREEADRAIAAKHFSQREDLQVWSNAVADELLKVPPPGESMERYRSIVCVGQKHFRKYRNFR
jgi:hypothetical protein